MKQTLKNIYWAWYKVLFFTFMRDDSLIGIDFIWYNRLDKRNGKLIIDSVKEATKNGLNEITIKLYNHEPIKVRWK